MFCLKKEKTNSTKCTYEQDFGNYAELWKHHKDNYKFIVRITKDYIVFVNKNNDVDWETTDEFDDNLKGLPEEKDFNKFISECQNLDQQPIEGLNESSIVSLKKIIGEAIVNCFEFNYEAAIKILVDAEKFRSDRLIEKSREWYLTNTILLTITFTPLIFLITKYNLFNIQNSSLEMINSGAFAIIGACFSIILRSGQLCHASYAGKRLHFLESSSRLLGGFITGIIIYFGFKSGIIFASIITKENSLYLLPLLAIIAGSSERFTPSIITQIEKLSIPETNGAK
ncbi:hypothetical protein F9230_07625 [Acinetobacter johnsonii]|uniref:hypothetical protein n=1 Tax=Acinetobacter johnsonii TaxID=40214 RepID=UPI001F312540|nr:hypothetical protein [Acinetobacter johnsonii]UJA04226.1 hypothetical protein F9230_07625 [Acinetobacter johnsonii]